MVLSDLHKQILQGKICPYCKGKTQFVDSSVIYGKSYGMIYLCSSCDAYCGVHRGTNISLGRLANSELRKAKREAHTHFDLLWKEGYFGRNELYHRLSQELSIPRDYCHIGMFSVETCKRVVEWSKNLGLEVDRPH
jgi:hypothetical protein